MRVPPELVFYLDAYLYYLAYVFVFYARVAPQAF